MTGYILKENIPSIEKAVVNGVAKIRDINLRLNKRKEVYAEGELALADGSTVPFKIWGSKESEEMHAYYKRNPTNSIFYFNCTVNVWQGNTSLILDSNQVPENTVDPSVFNFIDDEAKKYRASILSRLNAVIKKNLTPKGLNTINAILKKDALLNTFAVEYAAKSMHDAKPIGLLHHTTKMLEILDLVTEQQNKFGLNETGIDLIFIGLTIHDIGKVKEYSQGIPTNVAKVTHRGLGIEMLVERKDIILENYSLDFYYELMAIINQHHGIYEEKPHTVFSYLVHLIDMHDTHLTILSEKMSENKEIGEVRIPYSDLPALEMNQDYLQ